MKKAVLKCAIEDEKSKRRAMKIVAGVEGVESVAVDMKERKITVIGEVDPVFLTGKLRKFGFTELLSVGPVKEEKKIGGKEYLGVQNMGLNRVIEDEGSEKRIKEAVEGFGDFNSVEVDVKQGMVTVVGDLVPVRLAIQIRELGYRAKLRNVGSAGADMVVKVKEGPDSVLVNPTSYIVKRSLQYFDSACCIV